MTVIRKSTPSDISAISDLGLEALNRWAYPNLVISEEKVRSVALDCVSSPRNFSWVAEEDGAVVAAVSAIVHDMMFHERKQASVVQFYTRSPNAGIPLIRKFLEWARGRKAIKCICFTLECNADPRIGKMLERLGLNKELPVYMEAR